MPESSGPVDAAPNAHLRKTVLPNGLLVITERLPHIRSVAIGLAFRLGSRDDPEDRPGIAHLVEHMVFKGTPDRDARSISVAAESLGAELNAFTDKEFTCFYARCPCDQQVLVTELLAEIIAQPAFAPAELAKEQSVVAEEIKTAEENPDYKATSLLFEAAYPGHMMGQPVIGNIASVSQASSEELRRLYQDRYHCGTGLAIVAGDVSHDGLVTALANRLSAWSTRPVLTRDPASPRCDRVLVQTRRELSQVYLCLARPSFAYPDPRRYALSVLNTAFGAGISSRLFQRLREDEGLVYSVSSFTELYADTGLFGIYFVADQKKLKRCIAVLKEETAKLRQERLQPDEFERARNMTKSSVLLALESPTSRMVRLARTQLMFGRTVPVDETVSAYNRLTRQEVDDLIPEALDSDFCVGAVGPVSTRAVQRLIAGPA